jgi:hypothetical protein
MEVPGEGGSIAQGRPLGSRMVCTRCGHIGADVQPDWGRMSARVESFIISLEVDTQLGS